MTKYSVLFEGINMADINRQLDNLAKWMQETFPGTKNTKPANGSITFQYKGQDIARVVSNLRDDVADQGQFFIKDFKNAKEPVVGYKNIPDVKTRLRALMRATEIDKLNDTKAL